MKHYTLSLLMLVAIMSACSNPKQSSAGKTYKSIVSISASKRKRNNIETYSLQHKNNMLVFAKVSDKKALVKIENDEWPDETVYAYNVLKDDAGKIMMIDASPLSESGDWDVSHTHYFDDNGNTFLFERKANAFSDCLTNDSVAYETVKKYYALPFRLIEQQDILVNKDGKTLDKSKCTVDFAIEDAIVYPDVNTCLKAYGINIR